MIQTNAKTNKVLMLVLFSALAIDLAGRAAHQSQTATAEMASSSDCDLAGQYAKSVKDKEKQDFILFSLITNR